MSNGSMRQRSAGSWELKYETGADPVTGKRRTRFKTVRGTKTEAQKELRRLLGQVDTGTHANAGKLTLGQYLDDWLAGHRATISPRTAERYAEHIEKHIKPSLGHLALAKVTTAVCNAFYADKLATGRLDGHGGLSAQTVRHLDRLMHKAFADAVPNLLAINPLAPDQKPKRPKVEPKPKQKLSDEELSALLDRAEGGRLYAPIMVMLATGLRRGELLGLRWRAVNIEAGKLFVVASIEETKAGLRIKPPKTDQGSREVDFGPSTVQVLKDHRHQQQQEHLALGIGWTADTLVFASVTGEIWRPRNFTKVVTRLAASAGVRISPHGFRHDHFSRLLEGGVHAKTAQLRAGHSSVAITMDVYSHATRGLQTAAVEHMEHVFSEIRKAAGGKPVAKGVSGPEVHILKP